MIKQCLATVVMLNLLACSVVNGAEADISCDESPLQSLRLHDLTLAGDRDAVKDLPEGAVVTVLPNDESLVRLVGLYRQGFEPTRSVEASVLPLQQPLVIIVVGPLLDAQDAVGIAGVSCSGKTTRIRVNMTKVREHGAQMRFNYTWRPLLTGVWKRLLDGGYEVIVDWQEVTRIPGGKPAAGGKTTKVSFRIGA